MNLAQYLLLFLLDLQIKLQDFLSELLSFSQSFSRSLENNIRYKDVSTAHKFLILVDLVVQQFREDLFRRLNVTSGLSYHALCIVSISKLARDVLVASRTSSTAFLHERSCHWQILTNSLLLLVLPLHFYFKTNKTST